MDRVRIIASDLDANSYPPFGAIGTLHPNGFSQGDRLLFLPDDLSQEDSGCPEEDFGGYVVEEGEYEVLTSSSQFQNHR